MALSPNLNTNNLRIPPGRTSNTLGPATRGLGPRKGALERIDIDKIGKGYLMTEGSYNKSFGMDRDVGLKGQLSAVRRAGIKTTTKNLSRENIEQMHDLLSSAISKNSVSSNTYISRRDRTDILKKSRDLARTPGSKFSLEDRKDLIKIVDEMRRQSRDKLLNNSLPSNPQDTRS